MINNLCLLLFLFLSVYCEEDDIYKRESLNLHEGSKCKWDGVDGVCRSVYDCVSAMGDIKKKNYPPICSFEGVKPIICCADCKSGYFVNFTGKFYWCSCNAYAAYGEVTISSSSPGSYSSTINAPASGKTIFCNRDLDTDVNLAYYKTGEKSRDKCLEYYQKLNYPCEGSPQISVLKHKHHEKNCYTTDLTLSVISGGRNAGRDQFPHMALLGYGNNIETAQWLCGGSVISEKYILTAAHCISSPSVGPVKYVALGILKRSDPPDLWQKYNVKRIITHPEYQPPSKYNDIALLETDTTISFNVHVLPACLHLRDVSDVAADATGWGALGHHRELAETLQTVTLERFEETECQRAYPKHRHLRQGYNHTTQMCYGHRGDPKDTCEGDSGGPLQSTGHLSDCLFTVLGVTSFGRSCGFLGGSGMYTRVYHYVPWIESVVWP